MITKSHPSFMSKATRRTLAGAMFAAMFGLVCTSNAGNVTSTVTLADAPIFATSNVPGNMVFTPSVEFPTAISVANLGNYADGTTYLGYFDPAKCYDYQYNSAPESGSTLAGSSSYFQPTAFAGGTNGHSCTGKWSGNFMNWATMQTIDPFRWALTGGYRAVDQISYPQTILEKAWGANQGGTNNFPYRGTGGSGGNTVSSALIPSLTPFSWSTFNSAIWSNGNMMAFSGDGSSFSGTQAAYGLTDLSSVSTVNGAPTAGYRVYIRVSVCDTTLGTAGLESNCVKYGSNIYKPQGLIQQYSNQIKYAVMGYLNTANQLVQGSVLREPMEFVGPTYPQPLSNSVITNPNAEWSATNGIMSSNPDPTTASNSAGSAVSQSGVMNYLNKFGEYGASQGNYTNTYMTYDHVSEMYYAAVRYYENLGNVPEWLPNSAYGAKTTQLDGFPAVTTWSDPISYYCQNNFILGIGDDHTWDDYNVGGSTATGSQPIPAAVASDTFNQANTWTNSLQNLEGISQTPWWPFDTGATYYIAGLAYGTHVSDIRPSLGVIQNGTKTISTISTYWMDVAEDQEVENLNPYYLATKYGGFTVPSGYLIGNTTPLSLGEYDTTGNNIVMNGNQTHPLPDNYFETGNASTMVASLKSAFSNIAIAITPHTTSFSLSSPIVASSGAMSYASQYASSNWTSVITASTVTFPGGIPTLQNVWLSSSTLQTQLAGTGWQAPFAGGTTGRNVVTWSGSAGEPFEVSSLTSAQTTALTLGPGSYSPTTTVAQYLSYLRGDTTNQVGSTATPSTKSLRARTLFLGDIVDAGLTPVGTPSMSYSEATNPGYTLFTTQGGPVALWSTTTPRPTMVYAAANDGMLHAFVGTSGAEQFAYIPSALFQGPTNTPLVNGLAALGNPNFAHHDYVDATPASFDVDLNRTGGNTDTAGTSNWRTLLIGGLGKGGSSYYALDVTNPAAMISESAVAGKVLWEFTDSTMGYSFGTPVVVKTAQYGWVVVLTSGYDNSDGYGYLYIVNPANGALLQRIKTPIASSGLAQASAFVENYTDYTADSVYVGDLNGQLWRFDLTAATGNYPAPTQIAALTDAGGNPQPVTSAPDIEIHPTTRERYVMVGTGELLSTGDIGSSQTQTFYAIMDGTGGGFSAVSTPITRSQLTPVTNITAGVTIPAGFKGWYYDLPARYRVTTMPVSYNGIVAFAALVPTTDPCSPQGSSNVYAVDYSTGQSVINSTTSGSTTPATDVSFGTAITNLKIVDTNATIGTNGTAAGGTPELIACTTTGACSQVGVNLTGTLSTRLLNWREIPTAE
jgi:type IV pilus assembly protein PilY1